MHRSHRGFFLILMGAAVLIPSLTGAQEDMDGNVSCPAIEQFYVYVAGIPYGAKIGDKVNLYGKPCVSVEAKDVAAEGVCIAPNTCKANLCDGKPCEKPDVPGLSDGAPTSNEDPGGQGDPTKLPSFTSDEIQGTLQGGLPEPTQNGDLNDLLFNDQPISQSAQNFENQIKSASEKPGIIDSIRDWFFSPEPAAEQGGELDGGTVPNIDGAPVQTLDPGDTSAPSQSFQNDGLTPQQLIEQANTFSSGDLSDSKNPEPCGSWACWASETWQSVKDGSIFDNSAQAARQDPRAGENLADAANTVCKALGCDAATYAQALGGSCTQESQCDPVYKHGTSQYQGLGQLSRNSASSAYDALARIRNSENLTSDEVAEIDGVLSRTRAWLDGKSSTDPRFDPKDGAYLFAARQTYMREMGGTEPLENIQRVAPGDALTQAQLIQATQLAPSIHNSGQIFDWDKPLTASQKAAFSNNAIKGAQTLRDVIVKMDRSPAYGNNLPSGVQWMSELTGVEMSDATRERMAAQSARGGSFTLSQPNVPLPQSRPSEAIAAADPWSQPIVPYTPTSEPPAMPYQSAYPPQVPSYADSGTSANNAPISYGSPSDIEYTLGGEGGDDVDWNSIATAQEGLAADSATQAIQQQQFLDRMAQAEVETAAYDRSLNIPTPEPYVQSGEEITRQVGDAFNREIAEIPLNVSESDLFPNVPVRATGIADFDPKRSYTLAQLREMNPESLAYFLEASKNVPDNRFIKGDALAAINKTLIGYAEKNDGRIMEINGVGRDPFTNKEVGGVPNSSHLTGDAIDFCTTRCGYPLAEQREFNQMLRERGFGLVTHPHGQGPHTHAAFKGSANEQEIALISGSVPPPMRITPGADTPLPQPRPTNIPVPDSWSQPVVAYVPGDNEIGPYQQAYAPVVSTVPDSAPTRFDDAPNMEPVPSVYRPVDEFTPDVDWNSVALAQEGLAADSATQGIEQQLYLDRIAQAERETIAHNLQQSFSASAMPLPDSFVQSGEEITSQINDAVNRDIAGALGNVSESDLFPANPPKPDPILRLSAWYDSLRSQFSGPSTPEPLPSSPVIPVDSAPIGDVTNIDNALPPLQDPAPVDLSDIPAQPYPVIPVDSAPIGDVTNIDNAIPPPAAAAPVDISDIAVNPQEPSPAPTEQPGFLASAWERMREWTSRTGTIPVSSSDERGFIDAFLSDDDLIRSTSEPTETPTAIEMPQKGFLSSSWDSIKEWATRTGTIASSPTDERGFIDAFLSGDTAPPVSEPVIEPSKPGTDPTVPSASTPPASTQTTPAPSTPTVPSVNVPIPSRLPVAVVTPTSPMRPPSASQTPDIRPPQNPWLTTGLQQRPTAGWPSNLGGSGSGSSLFGGGLQGMLGNLLSGFLRGLVRDSQERPPQLPPQRPPESRPPTTPVIPEPSVAIVANPSIVKSGSTTVLTWASARTDGCVISAPNISYHATTTPGGSTTTPTLIETTVFAITCQGQSGAASGEVRVAVE